MKEGGGGGWVETADCKGMYGMGGLSSGMGLSLLSLLSLSLSLSHTLRFFGLFFTSSLTVFAYVVY